jgi:hypothetical protein
MYTDFYGQKWYKGNLHTHTSRSDGKVSYEEAVSRYRHAGYDFLSITDHWITSETSAEDNFLLLSGCEYDTSYLVPCDNVKRTVIIHINAIGFTSVPKLVKSPDLRGQEIIDAIKAAGGIAIFNHPEWSRNLPSDIAHLKNLAGVEIYNSGADSVGTPYGYYGYSGFHVDQLALQGINLPVFACDDAHYYTGDECKSFIMVQAESLSRDSILEAINKGRFYASQGPWLRTELKERTLKVTCTPVTEILVYSNKPDGYAKKSAVPVTGAEFQIVESDYYYRVEIIDRDGNMAWTSPVGVG